MRRPALLVWCFIAFGAAVYAWACIRVRVSPTFVLVGLLPWIIAAGLLKLPALRRGLAFGAGVMLIIELATYWRVFIHPSASTAALAYIVKSPLQITCLLVVVAMTWAVGMLLPSRDSRRR